MVSQLLDNNYWLMMYVFLNTVYLSQLSLTCVLSGIFIPSTLYMILNDLTLN